LLAGKKLCIFLYLGCHAAVRFLRDIHPGKVTKIILIIFIFPVSYQIVLTVYAWWMVLLGHCPLPHFCYWLIAGFLLFFFGMLVQTLPLEEWLGKGRLKALFLIFRAILFAATVAGGGFITTYGWNERDNYINKQALLFAAAMEWKQNDMRNVEIEVTLSHIRQRDYKTLYFFIFPTNHELTRAIDITQLERRRIQQSFLDLAILEYTQRIDYLNTRLYAANIAGHPFKVYRKLIDSIFGRGDAYPDYLIYHRVVEKILRKKHPGLLERVDWMQRKMIDRRKERVDELTEPADPNDQPNDY